VKLGRQLRIGFSLLIAIQLATSLAGIGLLGRMSPAIGRILEANDTSVGAVEVMLAVLAAPVPTEEGRRRFVAALETAEGNITEPEERPLLQRIRAGAVGAMEGNAGQRIEVVGALTALGDVNRQAMRHADGEAKRLGFAGRWALAFLALVGLFASVLSIRRAHERWLAPLVELEGVLSSHRAGDPHRRCRPLPDTELSVVLTTVNEILDSDPAAAPSSSAQFTNYRSAVPAILDSLGKPSILLDDAGKMLGLSQSALPIMTERGDEILSVLRAGTTDAQIEEVVELAPSSLRLVRLR
jgi:hypothetical protein